MPPRSDSFVERSPRSVLLLVPLDRSERVRQAVRSGLLALLLVCAFASTAYAQIARQCVIDYPGDTVPSECRTHAFDIEITSVMDPFGLYGAITPGSTVSGTFTTFTAFSDVDSSADTGQYVNAIECMTLVLGDRVMAVELEPLEISVPSSSDPGITVMNDVEQGIPGFSLFADSITYLIAGPGSIDPNSTPDPEATIRGGGGFSFGLGDACFTPGQTPCPRLLLEDDGFPDAPGDTTGLTSALMTFDFLSVANEFATADADLLAITDAELVPCPEPGFGSLLAAGSFGLAMERRRRWRSR